MEGKTLTIKQVENKLSKFKDCNYNSWREISSDPSEMDRRYTTQDSLTEQNNTVDMKETREYNQQKIDNLVKYATNSNIFSPQQKQCLKYYLQGKSCNQTAEKLNISKQTVSSQLKRAFNKLKKNSFRFA